MAPPRVFTISDRFICFILMVKRRWQPVLKKGRQLFLRKKVHPGDLAGGFSDLEMTWLLYCAGVTTEK